MKTPPKKVQELKPVQKPTRPAENVPQFYFPNGKPVKTADINAFNDAMDKVFGKGATAKTLNQGADLDALCNDLLMIPKIFRDMLYTRIEKQ